MELKKFNEYCEKIISECNTSLFNKKLYEDHWFAPKTPFKITKDMLVDKGFELKDLGSWAGQVKEILSEDEIIYEVVNRMNIGKEILEKYYRKAVENNE